MYEHVLCIVQMFYMYKYVYISIYIEYGTYIYTYMHTHTHTQMHVYIYIFMYVSTREYMHGDIDTKTGWDFTGVGPGRPVSGSFGSGWTATTGFRV